MSGRTSLHEIFITAMSCRHVRWIAQHISSFCYGYLTSNVDMVFNYKSLRWFYKLTLYIHPCTRRSICITVPVYAQAPGTVMASERTMWTTKYCQTSSISCTKSKNFNVSRLVLQLSLPNLLKPDVKLKMKMSLEQRRQAMLLLYLNQQSYCLLRCDLY